MAPSDRAGHVLIGAKAFRVYAHRHAYQLAHGPIPAGAVVRHRCDDPACINPAHLELGTQGQNVGDAVLRERRNAFGRQRLQLSDVVNVRAAFAQGVSQKAIARAYGVSKGCIHAIVRGRSWRGQEAFQSLPALTEAAQRHPHLHHGLSQRVVHTRDSQPHPFPMKGRTL